MTTWNELERSGMRPAFRALADRARRIGDLQVRNLGTIGGGLAHADPAADMPAVTIALGARLTGARRPASARSTPGVRAGTVHDLVPKAS